MTSEGLGKPWCKQFWLVSWIQLSKLWQSHSGTCAMEEMVTIFTEVEIGVIFNTEVKISVIFNT